MRRVCLKAIMKVFLQSESSECGLACLAMIADYYGHHSDLAQLRRRFSISLKGVTLGQLIRHAASLKLTSRPLRVELEEVDKLKLPCILHWNFAHFVVLKKIDKTLQDKSILVLLDPAVGERRVNFDEASKAFTGVALEVTPSPDFMECDKRKKVKLSNLTGPIVGIRKALSQVFMLAGALEIFALAAPLFSQFVLDEVIVSGDKELLTVLVMGFGLLMITQNAISLARSWFLMRWSMDISIQWSSRVFGHLIRLPVSFFEKRHLGDVVSRFSSISAIQGTLTSVFVEGALDGLMALLAIAMMLTYSAKLTLVAIIPVCLYAILRWAFYRPFRDAAQERLVLSAKESSHFLESIRAISPLKLFGMEDERRSQWLNLKQDVQNRDVKTQRMAIMFKVFNTAIFSTQSLALFYIGAGSILQNTLTIGMLMAFSSYSGTFTNRVFNLIDNFVNFRLLDMHTERLADIALEHPEADVSYETDLGRIDHSIMLKNIKFRYAEGEPWVLN